MNVKLLNEISDPTLKYLSLLQSREINQAKELVEMAFVGAIEGCPACYQKQVMSFIYKTFPKIVRSISSERLFESFIQRVKWGKFNCLNEQEGEWVEIFLNDTEESRKSIEQIIIRLSPVKRNSETILPDWELVKKLGLNKDFNDNNITQRPPERIWKMKSRRENAIKSIGLCEGIVQRVLSALKEESYNANVLKKFREETAKESFELILLWSIIDRVDAYDFFEAKEVARIFLPSIEEHIQNIEDALWTVMFY